MVSPLRVDDVVYLLENGPLLALEAKTGQQIYRKQLANQIYRGNMVYGDGKIYIVGRQGIGQVVEAGKGFKILPTNDLEGTGYASPANSHGRIYIRSWDHLWCIGAK